MFRIRRSVILVLTVIVMLLIVIGNVTSAEFPEKEIEWVIWSSPGGGSDLTARTIGMPMRRALGQPLVIVNMPGGDGARAITYVMGQPADGYTWLFTTNTLITAIELELVPYTFDDFIPVAMLNFEPESLNVSAASQFETVEDLIEAGKERPLKWGVTGLGDAEHCSVDLFARTTGVKYNPVVYQGGGEQIAALLEGSIDCILGNPAEIMGQVEGGNLRVLAVLGEERIDILPEVPTAKERGFEVVAGTIRGISVKKGTPPEVIDKIEEYFLNAATSDTYQGFLKSNSISPDSVKDGEGFKQYYLREWATLVNGLKSLGIIK